MSKLPRALALLSLTLLLMGSPARTSAKSVSGITVSPALQPITVNQDQASKSFDFAVTNNDPVEQELHLSAVDFGSLDDTGGVLFLGPEKSLSYKYGLARWITLEKDVVLLQPHETQKILVTIDNKASLTPGGHYGAVLVTPQSEQTSKQQTQVTQVASALLFLTKEGGAHYHLQLVRSDLNAQLATLPGRLSLRFQNTGNVHVIPRGLITITDPRGREVKKGIINSDSGLAMPESFREMTTPLSSVASAYLPGIYHARISYYYEGQASAPTTLVTTFFYCNGWYLIGLIIGLFGALYFMTHRRHWIRLRQTLRIGSLRRPSK
jgi:methionine-rich copper-binding protein CopC